MSVSLSRLFAPVVLAGAALTTGCASYRNAVDGNSLPTPNYVAGRSITEPVEVNACDRLGFHVWDNTARNQRELERRGSTVEQYNGRLIEYRDFSFMNALTLVGAVAAKSSGIGGIIVGGVFGRAAGSELDKVLEPGKLSDLRACKTYLDQLPARASPAYPVDYRNAPVRPRPQGWMR